MITLRLLVPMLNDVAVIWFSFVCHVTWQASLVAVAFLAVAERRPHWSSPLRYGLLLLALAKFALPPAVSLPTGLFSHVGPVVEALPDASKMPRIGRSRTSTQMAAATQVQAGPAVEEVSNASVHAGAVPLFCAPVLEGRAWLMLLHGTGAVAVSLWIVASFVVIRRVLRGATEVHDGPLYKRFAELSGEFGMPHPPRLLLTRGPCGPAASGVLRPAVLLPDRVISLDRRALDDILSHELAHHSRRDLWFNWLQLALTTVWWFNPVLWVLNRQIRELREDCCDDLLLARKMTTARGYCETLLMAASELTGPASAAVSLGLGDGLHPLRRRFRRIMDQSLQRTSRLSFAGLFLLALIAVVVLPGLSLSQADPLSRRAQASNSSVPIEDQEALDHTEQAEDRNTTDAEAGEWPELATVSGRVVDHQGQPVFFAEVLLLGEERIVVEAGRKTWFILEKDVPRPPSTRTNRDGNFAIRRVNGAADRLAVISSDPLLWIVPRGKLKRADYVDIELPASGALAIQCDLPGQPANLPVMFELKAFEGDSRSADLLRFHEPSFSLDSSGETRFAHLPPGQYAVQRYVETKTGPKAVYLTDADRQLVRIESKRQAKIQID